MHPARTLVVDAAISQLGLRDPLPYWRDVLPDMRPPYPRSWCGAGYLWCLHRAGLALDVSWVIGLGLAGGMSRYRKSFPQTNEPEPGDLAYFLRNQHHAVVVAVGHAHVNLVNFNGRGGVVTESTSLTKDVRAFYSIANLLPSEPRAA
jgi:hypothetical protein